LLRWIYGVRAGIAGTGACDGLGDGPVRCIEAGGLTWNDVLREDRPMLLQLVDEHRFERRALLVGVDAQQALLATRGGIERVDLRRVAESWTGVAWHYWTPPEGMNRTLGRGDRGADVQEAARLFAQLDEQARPLTDDVFDARLETRTRLFQRRHGLRDDGVMGAQTLRALVLAAGEDLDLATARRRLEQRSASLQTARDNG
jgi:general secretion pathway protein A